MKPRRIVIVGAGVAGHRCALELRRCGFAGEVVLTGAEPHLPYDRTLLSKDFLQGTVAAADITLMPRADYEGLGIELRLGTAAAAISPATHELTFRDGTTVGYDRLAVATGGSPARPAMLCDGGGQTLRTLDDAVALHGMLASSRKLVVIGGGFVGAEVAASARACGVEVTILEALSAPLQRAVGAEVGGRIAELHRAHGVDVLTGTPARAVRRVASGQLAVEVAEGRTLRADSVFVGAGMAPATSWLAGSGIIHDGAVIVDAACRTAAPDVLAAGDCTRWFHPGYGDWVHVEHWDTAGHHGAAAARAMLDDAEQFAPVPFFWSYQHGVRFQWIGQPNGWDTVEIEDHDPPDSFVARYRCDDRLVAVFAANQPRTIAAARMELRGTPEVVV